MFYFFSKTISYLITPAGWLVVALVLAYVTKNAVQRRRLIGLAFGIFWLFGNAFLVNEVALRWEIPPTPVPTNSTLTTAVVLTGGMIDVHKATPDHRYLLDHEADRAGQALYLYKRGAVQKILISGGSGNLPFQTKSVSDEGQMTARFLITAGVRPADIMLENKSRNTHENAVFTSAMLRKQLGTNRCVLVTSAWHMRRALSCFRREGLEPVPFPGAFMSRKRSLAPGEWLLPNEQTFADAYFLVKEITGYLVYTVAGYV